MTNPRDKRLIISKVNTTPVGLQNLLGNVNQGINPHELDHRISPVVDLYPHWATRKIQHGFEYNTLSQSGILAKSVPEGELWQMISMSVTKTSLTTGDDISLSVGVSPTTGSGSGNYVRMASTPVITTLSTTGLVSCGFTFPERFILGGGWIIKGFVELCTQATASDSWFNYLYVKLTD